MPIEVDLAVLPEKILAQGVNSEVAPVKDNIKIGVKFLHLMCCPERLWPKGPGNKVCNKTGGLFSVICKKLFLSGGLLVEVNMAVLPERFFAKGFNSVCSC